MRPRKRSRPRKKRRRSSRPSERRADSRRDFAIVLDDRAQVAAESVLVELFAGPRIPQSATVGRELVAQHERPGGIVDRMTELELVVNEVDTGIPEERLQQRIDAMSQLL